MAAELLSGKTVLLTGASGIAAATAKLFCQHGARVAVLDRSADNLNALRGCLPELVTLEGDLTDSRVCKNLVAQAAETLGKLDVLVNVVGISGRKFGDGPVHEATDEGFDVIMSTNVKTTFVMCREALQYMLPQGTGSIVNTASVLAYAPNAEHFSTHAYAASKGALISLTRAMASSYAAHGIRVNALAPGLIETPMSKRAQGDSSIIDYVSGRQPLTGKFGQPEDVAGAALFLASDLSAFVTGEVLEVAGGWSVAG